MNLSPFHISVPVSDLASARHFYGDLLGCLEGRSTDARIDFNFFGHHLVAHLEPTDAAYQTRDIESGGIKTPCRHFGLVLREEKWDELAEKLQGAVAFYLEPQRFHAGLVNEQKCMLVHDNCGNIVEFKADPVNGLFAKPPSS